MYLYIYTITIYIAISSYICVARYNGRTTLSLGASINARTGFTFAFLIPLHISSRYDSAQPTLALFCTAKDYQSLPCAGF